MIENVPAIERTEAVSITVASGLAARNGRMWREKRLKFLGALREATGDAGALGDAVSGDLVVVEGPTSRADISESYERIALLAPLVPREPRESADAAAVARRIGEAGPQSIAVQARIGAGGVERLVTAGTR